jgi:hypothetical protein
MVLHLRSIKPRPIRDSPVEEEKRVKWTDTKSFFYPFLSYSYFWW